MLSDQRLLLGILFQDSLGNDERDIVACDTNLLETILHASQRVCHELEPRIVEQALLDAGNEAEPRSFADLAKLPQEGEVEAQRLIGSRAQIIEKLVEHEDQASVGMHGLEGRHHLLEG